ncbi:HemK family methyltransferase [Biscogniauxia sp. FL1348]|nr:HemK family methyltransferase [Biscogniauxia sp. FL1348]
MPRIRPTLLRAAHRICPHIATLLPACRDLPSARNELRWIREHARSTLSSGPYSSSSSSSSSSIRRHAKNASEDALVARLCRRRATGTPLQYVLGSLPFGPLDLRCRPGVLIPRPETEAWVAHLAGVVMADGDRDGLKVLLDVCSGSGCVALLLYALLLQGKGKGGALRVRGLDVEPRAVALARENRARNARIGVLPGGRSGEEVVFERADVFREDWVERLVRSSSCSSGDGNRDGDGMITTPRGDGRERVVDVLVSNPPYISVRGFERDTARSVRNFEPRRALVPSGDDAARYRYGGCAPEDVFYARLLEVAAVLRPSIAAFEVGDLDQAVRVVRMAARRPERWDDIEIWRDWPDLRPAEGEAGVVRVDGRGDVPVRGSGHGRVVFLRRRV